MPALTGGKLSPSRADLIAEYAALRQDIQHIAGRVDTIRTFGVGIVGAALILALQQRLAVVALGGAALAHCFALIDLTGAYRYATFASRARRVELALDAYEYHARVADTESKETLQDSLDDLEKRPFQLELNEPGPHEMAFTYPRAVFRVLYPALLAAGGLLAIGLQFDRGPALAAAAVTTLVLGFWAACAPSYMDPTRPPLRWWLRARISVSGARRLGLTVSFGIVTLLSVAVFLLWPVVREPELQRPGSLSVAATPAPASVSVRLSVRPSCSSVRADLLITAGKSARSLVVRLPSNFRARNAPDSAAVTLHRAPTPARLMLEGTPSEVSAGRCILALPALVGTGQAEKAKAFVQIPSSARLTTEDAVGFKGAPTRVEACTTVASAAPALTCAAVLRLEESASAKERLWRLAIAAVLIVIALISAASLLVRGRGLSARRPQRDGS